MKRAILVLAALLYAETALGEAAFEFTAPGMRVPDDPAVNGMRLSLLHGKNTSVRGFDIGLLSLSETAEMSGVSIVAGVNRVTGRMSGGAAISLINFHSGRDTGLNAAFINKLNDTEDAFNISFLNIADGATLVDLGGLNMSARSTAQIGFVNVTKNLKSFQFGFLNIAENGFLPVFPVVNFPK